MIRVYFPHANLGCLGIEIADWYFDVSIPARDGFGFAWGSLLRIYWRYRGRRHWLYLPGFRHCSDR